MKRIAINGFGRIGRIVFRILNDENYDLDVVAINDLTDAKQLAYLLKYDSAHRNYKLNDISYEDDYLIVGDKKIKVLSEADPSNLPWKQLDIDIVLECTGFFTEKEKAMQHIKAGAKKVLISAPAKGDLKTVVYNVNDDILDGSEEVVSAASCTTNCLAPVLKVMDENFGIKKGYMTTVHAITNDQSTLDIAHKKGINSRRGRAAGYNIVPTSTGAASAIGLVLPQLAGKLDGIALRVPVVTGSIVDLVLELNEETNVEEINMVLKNSTNETLNYTEDPIVSSDIIGRSCGALVDALSTSIVKDEDGKQLVKVLAWYDNEAGYSYQMVRTLKKLSEFIK
mgnify:FL=1|jgi:glyceraldehyde-3-phosphate dehydrogenase, type I